ncbi:glycine zipper domain-containing protein [Thioalkalivibrio sp. ALE19]|uniref:glycine zipper domain-containing protein n=1 Tax=Thioalkalivibrio sp. ALE19 TaxID=1266909 RepID=UPI000428BCE0|nr:glycine zipper domain-containing protein [Thioalkalivibrio sp. ALE19]
MSVLNMMKIVAAIITTAFLVGCANTPVGSGDYGVNQTRSAGSVETGKVVDIREVTIREDSRTAFGSRGGVGAAAGAAAGALLGDNVGSGRGRQVARTVGAGAGAVAGSHVDRELASQSGLEIEVRKSNGRHVVVTQGDDQDFHVGQHVRLIEHGRTYRVAP